MQEGLTSAQIEQFVQDGFVRVDNAFSEETAGQARHILWQDLPGNPHNPATWRSPVVRLGMYAQAPFVEAANTPILVRAFDQLVGSGNWIPCRNMGTFPVRFPSNDDPGDAGWHVDASFPGDDPSDYVAWRINVRSKGRALLMLFLFSDVTELDAPTRIRIGSHKDVARLLNPAGEKGLSFIELADRLGELPQRPETAAIGKAGTVYLCHPFLAHAAQPHRGTEPRFMAQPPLLLSNDLSIDDSVPDHSPLEVSIRMAVNSQ
ncbi:phytanoyl-CoA dioxygenase family protein [Spirosoma aerophilum]